MPTYMNQALNPKEVESYIRQAAISRRIDPATALRVWGSEGRSGYVGDKGSSFGPFQLHYGGVASGGNRVAGLGDDFTKKTGLDARDPSTWKQQVDFSLDNAAKTGWGPWHGAAKIGLPNNAGIPSLVGSPAPKPDGIESAPPPMSEAMTPTQSNGFEGMNSFGNALLGVGGALQNINNPGAGNSLIKMAMENMQTPKMQFRGFMPNGKGMVFTDARGNEQIRPVPEAYQGQKESDSPASVKMLEALIQRPELYDMWEKTHKGNQGQETALDEAGIESAAEGVLAGNKSATTSLTRKGKELVTNKIAEFKKKYGVTDEDIMGNQGKWAGVFAQERRYNTRLADVSQAHIDLNTSTQRTKELLQDPVLKGVLDNPRLINQAGQFIASQLNSEQAGKVAQLNEALESDSRAYSRVMSFGGANSSVRSDEVARNLLNSGMSSKVITDVLDFMNTTGSRVKTSLEGGLTEMRSKARHHTNLEDYNKSLSEWESGIANQTNEEISRKFGGQAKQSPDTSPKASEDVPVVNSPEEARKLPPGTKFKTPDGRMLIR